MDLTGTGPWEVIYAINGFNQPPIIFNSSPQIIQAGEGQTITLISVTTGGCPGTISGSVTIGTLPSPTADIFGSGNVCAGSGDLVDLILNLTGTGPWEVVFAINGIPQPPVVYNTSPQIVQAGENQTISINSVVAAGCTGQAFGSVTIGTLPAPIADLVGSGNVCAGSGEMINLILNLSGVGPWEVIYAINGIDQPVVLYNTSPQLIQAGEGETISISSIVAVSYTHLTLPTKA